MMSKGSKLPAVLDWESTSAIAKNLNLCLAQMAMTLSSLTSACQAYHEAQYHLEALRDVLLDSQAKPSKKRPRTVKPRTSTRRKA